MNDSPNGQATQFAVEAAGRLQQRVLQPLKEAFVAKDEVIDLLGICLVAGENLFVMGPPGTAKSLLVQELAQRIEGRVFDYLLTRFTEPNEIFGPFDIRKLREGELQTNTEGMLPEADLVFLDELLNANSAILNSLLMVLNERVFRRGRETRQLSTLMVVGASNRLPEDDALGALFDRFLLRAPCENVPAEMLESVLTAGWRLERKTPVAPVISVEEIHRIQASIPFVQVAAVRDEFAQMVRRLRQAGLFVSDRRAVRLQRVMAASALLSGRDQVNPTDFWLLRYIWDTEEQRSVLTAIVQEHFEQQDAELQEAAHPRAQGAEVADAEELARGLEALETRTQDAESRERDQTLLEDQLRLLASRCQWVPDEQKREFLQKRVTALWNTLGKKPPA